MNAGTKLIDTSTAMLQSERPRMEGSESRLRLQTAVRLRWFGVAGQLLTVCYVYFGLGFQFDIGICLALIALTAWLNVFLRMRYSTRTQTQHGVCHYPPSLRHRAARRSALPYRRHRKPICVPDRRPGHGFGRDTAAAQHDRARRAGGQHHQPPRAFLPPAALVHAGGFDLPLLYNVGVLASVLAGMVFLALYVWRLAKEARQMTEALAATEMVLAREQQLHALDGLAAAAAHELGTPLSTIAVVAKELAREAPKGGSFAEDVALLQSQAERCREILKKLTRGPQEPDPLHARINVRELIDEAAAPYRGFNAEIAISAAPEPDSAGTSAEPVGERRPGVIYGLANLVENAVDFADRRVEITATWSSRDVVITIADDGPGIPPLVLDALGEPYITTRPTPRLGQGADGEPSGMGLGFFIAKTLLERSGATVVLENRAEPATGAVAKVSWQRDVFEARPMAAQAAAEVRLDGIG